ncbi:ferric reductase-like transmembrane domain-containing protein [Pseudomonas violetae]|jgi:methionine sulfoxide reductase heme-binding subunit|uniref:Ferric reductase-like transmembrane domain-containing protein n=1 Tax=Pseudomonas violetae TaxID=2915813 RepID=A0ABT0EXX1_9PSED|nr:ferric reductase-like transmembrane domain-containing protein [Pseudomonas violetae]MCK1790301.1 ferric reductase-like transmembrane domain-containing protein [Pseudomonas violetae]
MNAQLSRFHGWSLFSLLSLLVLVMTALILALNPDLVEAARSAIRATARTSFALFLAAFTASAFAVLVPSSFSKTLVRERRFIGLAFAFSHLVHALLIYTYGQLNPEFWPGRTTVGNIPGSVGYLFIVLMTLTSFKATTRLIGRRAWRTIHVCGMWVLAAVFTYSNFKRIPLSAWYVVPFGIMCAAIAIRVIGKVAQMQKRSHPRAHA